MVARTGNALPRVQHAQLGKGREVYGFNLETVSWGLFLAKSKMFAQSLVFSGIVKPEGTYVEGYSPIVENTTLLSPQIFELSWNCLRFEVTQTYAERCRSCWRH